MAKDAAMDGNPEEDLIWFFVIFTLTFPRGTMPLHKRAGRDGEKRMETKEEKTGKSA